jgi:arginyl-tRNA synthetase
MQNRLADYRFSWDKMLALDGNTAPYLQYVYARFVRFSVGELENWRPLRTWKSNCASRRVGFGETDDRFGDALLEVERTYSNMLASFLYDLATKFNLFYQRTPYSKRGGVRPTRLLLCDLGALHTQRARLGIETLEAMGLLQAVGEAKGVFCSSLKPF